MMTRVARLYYEKGLRQTEIVDLIGVSQSTVSRLLKRAERENIVRITVNVPAGVYSELEEQLQQIYGLKDAVVVDSEDGGDESTVLRDVGRAAAHYVETVLQRGEVVGISSWSRALLSMMDTMPLMSQPTGAQVVQILGGLGDPTKDIHASALTRQFATLVRGVPRFLPAPGVARELASRAFFLRDEYVQQAIDLFPRVTLALVGIGAVGQSRKTSSSGVVFSNKELALVRKEGAVGDICLRFFDRNGNLLKSSLDKWVIGIKLEQLREVRRCIGIAGGRSKLAAIRGALVGGWINGLITDRITAERLVEQDS